MKNKVIAQKLQLQTMSDITDLLVAVRDGKSEDVTKALGAYSLHLQKIVDLVDIPCSQSKCGYLSCKDEMCDRMDAESWEVANDQ